MGWECFCVVGFDLGPLLQGGTRILHLQYFFKYVLSYSLHLNSYLVTFLHNTICRVQLFCPFLLSGSEFLLNNFNYHLLYFRTALSLILMLSSHYYLHKSKTLSQLTQFPFTGTLLLFAFCEFSRFRLACTHTFYCIKMSSNTQRTSKDNARSVKCRHFCLPFDSHNYCPSCREANKGDEPCVSFSDKQMTKIKNRKRYVRKQKADTSREFLTRRVVQDYPM